MSFAMIRLCLLTGSALAAPAIAQQEQADERVTGQASGGSGAGAVHVGDYSDEEEIVVTGQRERGAVVGDYKPEQQLNAGDVRALGVSSVAELLTELAPQVQSAGGGSPVVLLEGRRIASFREVGSIPSEAIARVDILPEEVALKYGYSATQKVVNIVLRQRFRAFTAEGTGRVSTHGDGFRLGSEGGFLAIRRGERVNIDVETTHTNAITEADRGLASGGGDGTDRTLTPETQAYKLTATWAKPISTQWLATVNGELTTNQSEALRGTAFAELPPLANTSSTQSGHLGLTINGSTPNWQWTLTSNYDHGRSRSTSTRQLTLLTYAAAVAAGDALVGADQSRSTTDSGDLDLVASGSLFSLPAGAVSTTFKVGGSTDRTSGWSLRRSNYVETSTARDQGQASVSIDIPLASDRLPLFGVLGRLSVNGNLAVRQISDVGTLRTFGGGLNWNPVKQISFIAAYRDDQSAPSASQIGSPILPTEGVDIFDYGTGQSVRVTTLTGGNPDLRDASLRNLRIGGTYRLSSPNITLNVDYNRTWQRGQIAALPGATPATLAAFPERFVRGTDGSLVSVDLRPINIEREDRSQLRWGLTFTKQLKTPQSQINAFRDMMQRRFPGGMPGGPGGGGEGGPPPAAASGDGGNAPAPSGAVPGGGNAGGASGGGAGPGGGPGGGRGFGGFGGGPGGPGGPGGGGRLTFSVFHTWVLSDRAVLRAGQPEIDLLNGGTIGAATGGMSRHKIEVQSGFSQSGLGLRLTGNWQSATRVDGITGYPATNLNFDDFATVDLRLFANLGQMPKIVEKVPFMRGARISFSVTNVFDARQKVVDGTGVTPQAYLPAYQDPLGRAFMVSFRKLFFTPPPAAVRRD